MDWDTWQNFGKKIANVQTPDAKLNLRACQDFEFGLREKRSRLKTRFALLSWLTGPT